MAEIIWSIIALVGAFVMVGGVMYFMVTGGGDRERDEENRVFFDAHGYWPDETPTHRGPAPRL